MNLTTSIKAILHSLLSRKKKPASVGKVVKGYGGDDSEPAFLYEGNGAIEIAERLFQLFDKEKPYLDPKLKLSELASSLGTNRNYLSKTINDYLQINFNQLCNYFRVREACASFLDNTGLENAKWIKKSGFGSYSSFSSCFSNFTGISPSRWKKEVIQRLMREEAVSVDDYIKHYREKVYGRKSIDQ